jgi:hypothetical protein
MAMKTLRMAMTADADGKVHFDLPVGPAGSEVEVVVTVRPKPAADDGTPESRGWPPGFIESTYGSIQDPAFRRYPQGEYEKRQDLD